MFAKSSAFCLALLLSLALAGPALAEPESPQPDCAQSAASQAQRQDERGRMVREQIKARGIQDPRVLAALDSRKQGAKHLLFQAGLATTCWLA